MARLAWNEFGFAAFRPDEFVGGQSVRVIFVSKADGRYLVCVPGPAWHRLVAQRVLPGGGLSKPESASSSQ